MAVTAGMVDMAEVKLTLSLQVRTVRNAVPRSIRVITIREICHEGFKLEGVTSLASTMGVAYVFCAFVDGLFPSFGLIRWLAPSSRWQITGSALAFISWLVMFTPVLRLARSMESRGGSGASN